MKVLWLSHFAPYPPIGGAMQRSYNMLKECSKTSDISFVSLASKSKVEIYYKDFESGLEEIDKELSKLCKDVTLIPHGISGRRKNKLFNATKSLFSSEAYDSIAYHSTRFEQTLQKLTEKYQFDIVHVDTVGLWQYTKFIESKKILLNHHNIESHMMSRRAKKSKYLLRPYLFLQAKKLEKLENISSSQATINITCSEMDGKRLQAINNCNYIEIPNGVDTAVFYREKEYKNNKIDLVFVGGLSWYPNERAMRDFASSIWPKIKQSFPEATMKVAGRGSVTELNKLAKEDPSYEVLGFVEDARKLIEESSIYVCPITDGGGTKLKILDALAVGIPIIADPIACEGITVVDNESVLFASTASDYIEKIVNLKNNMEARLTLSCKSQKLIHDKYSYEVIGEKIRAVYKL